MLPVGRAKSVSVYRSLPCDCGNTIPVAETSSGASVFCLECGATTSVPSLTLLGKFPESESPPLKTQPQSPNPLPSQVRLVFVVWLTASLALSAALTFGGIFRTVTAACTPADQMCGAIKSVAETPLAITIAAGMILFAAFPQLRRSVLSWISFVVAAVCWLRSVTMY